MLVLSNGGKHVIFSSFFPSRQPPDGGGPPPLPQAPDPRHHRLRHLAGGLGSALLRRQPAPHGGQVCKCTLKKLRFVVPMVTFNKKKKIIYVAFLWFFLFRCTTSRQNVPNVIYVLKVAFWGKRIRISRTSMKIKPCP